MGRCLLLTMDGVWCGFSGLRQLCWLGLNAGLKCFAVLQTGIPRTLDQTPVTAILLDAFCQPYRHRCTLALALNYVCNATQSWLDKKVPVCDAGIAISMGPSGVTRLCTFGQHLAGSSLAAVYHTSPVGFL